MKKIRFCFLATLFCLAPLFLIAEEIGSFRFIMPVASSGTASTMGRTGASASISESTTIGPVTIPTVSLSVSGSFEEEMIEEPTSSAFSLHYISPWGVGIGLTSQQIQYQVGLKSAGPTTVTGSISGVSTSYTLEDGYLSAKESISLNLGYLDLIYCFRFLEDFSVTGGLGLPVLQAQGDVSISSGTNRAIASNVDDYIQSSLKRREVENATAMSVFLMFGYEIASFEIIASYRQTNIRADFKLDSQISDFLDKDTIEWSLSMTEYLIGLGYRF